MNPTYPMSFEQESVWLNDQFQEGASRYLESWTYRLRGARIVPDAVRAALDGIVVRHEALRTRLHLVDGVPRQTVLRPSPVDLTVCSVTPAELSGALAEAAAGPSPWTVRHCSGRRCCGWPMTTPYSSWPSTTR